MLPVAPPVEGSEWLTSAPIAWELLGGRVVIVAFWSFGCEASLLRLRQVAELADAAGPAVIGIGVHTPRFSYEHDVDALRSVVTQHRFELPIVSDPDAITWNRYNPEGWPATVVINGRGRVVGAQHGSGDVGLLADSVALALRTTAAAVRSSTELSTLPPVAPLAMPDTDLAFPTSVAMLGSRELVVADSGHDRLVLFELDDERRVAAAVAEIAGFDRPTAIASDGTSRIVVAETAAGRVTLLDLEAQARQVLTDELVAPTGLTFDADGSVVVCDGGADKIYRLIVHNAQVVTMGLIAGRGTTGSADGPAADAQLAQPGGVARTEVGLVFADAASSNVRLLTDAGAVATITGSELFEWGLVDGPAHEAKLQRPTDLAVLDDGSILIVDTGNHRLRRLASRRIRTLGLAGLNRPSAACVTSEGHVVVADTGNHRLVVVDPELQTAWPLALDGVLPPQEPEPVPVA